VDEVALGEIPPRLSVRNRVDEGVQQHLGPHGRLVRVPGPQHGARRRVGPGAVTRTAMRSGSPAEAEISLAGHARAVAASS